jgi:hypothetical protein
MRRAATLLCVATLTANLLRGRTAATHSFASTSTDIMYKAGALVPFGWADGVLSGYVLPSLLHFGFGNGRPVGEIRTASIDAVPTPGGTELGMVGAF